MTEPQPLITSEIKEDFPLSIDDYLVVLNRFENALRVAEKTNKASAAKDLEAYIEKYGRLVQTGRAFVKGTFNEAAVEKGLEFVEFVLERDKKDLDLAERLKVPLDMFMQRRATLEQSKRAYAYVLTFKKPQPEKTLLPKILSKIPA